MTGQVGLMQQNHTTQGSISKTKNQGEEREAADPFNSTPILLDDKKCATK